MRRVPVTQVTDCQWKALPRHVVRDHASGGPVGDLRQRMNAILFLISADGPWQKLR
jgi:hypothetical protein